ncbi:Ger(x)C family spore germination protein [Paenibacillus flagellatus]|uniref:Ger(X)C family spore germination protein n=1 Tax=Paenibacillus flagellatus TaxID=2211139 RepID=A0A2V5KBG7_9BACL|nr:Ger(x)C family spore germination protein [Paenibacillus flagellatus]PYI56891.1 Ger(x)C family spore germination protein [Paenibacillus flagellatus]
MMRRFALSLLLLLLTAGCGSKMAGDFKDIDKRFFVMAIGVDANGDRENGGKAYRVTIKLGIPSPRIEPGKSLFQLLTQDADTITEAIRLLKSRVDKELDFGHMKTILLGRELAEQDMREPLEWMFRRRDIQKIAYVAVGLPDAETILKTTPKSERLPANALFLSFDQEGTESTYIVTERLSDFRRRMREKGLDPYLPVIETEGQNYRINRVALFDKRKMAAMLTPDETRVFHQLLRGVAKFPLHTKADHLIFSVNIQSYKRKFRFRPGPSGDPILKGSIKMEGIAEESNVRLFDKDWSRIEKEAERQSRLRTVALLEKLRNYRVDPLGFGLLYRATHYKGEPDWEDWLKLYPKLQFQVNVQLRLEGTGLIK